MMEPNHKKVFCVQNKMYLLAQMVGGKQRCCTDCHIWNCVINVRLLKTWKTMKSVTLIVAGCLVKRGYFFLREVKQ